jgi:hypothetical protein
MVEVELVDLAEPWPEPSNRPVLRHRLSYAAAGMTLDRAPATLRSHPRYIQGPDPLSLPFENPQAMRKLGLIAFAVAALVLYALVV